MKLCASNIAWPVHLEGEVFSLLDRHKILGVEVAPTKLWPDWASVSLESAPCFRERFSKAGVAVPALQAILFGKPEYKLFGNDEKRLALQKHLRYCADIAVSLGARNLVFGAPKNRELDGLPLEKALGIAREFFITVAKEYEEREVCLCLEANPSEYGCQFLTNSSDAAKLVRSVDRPGFRLHFDTACMYLAGEDIPAAIRAGADVLQHFHVSEPFLGTFGSPQADHAGAAAALQEIGYQGWVSLEMRETEPPIETLNTALGFLQNTYGGTNHA